MKIYVITLIFFLNFILPKNLLAQNNNETAAAAGVAAIAGIASAIAAVEQIKESLELTATEYVLENFPEFKQFELKTLDLNGKKMKDMSSVSVITFTIQGITNDKNKFIPSKDKKVLVAFTSRGWFNDYGLDYSKIFWEIYDKKEFENILVAFAKLAGPEQNEEFVREVVSTKLLSKSGFGSPAKLKFYKMDGDMYLVNDYSNKFKFVYNEKSPFQL